MIRALQILKEFLILVPLIFPALTAIRQYRQKRKDRKMKWLTLIAPIVNNSLELLKEKQRTKIMDEYKDLLDKLRVAENKSIGEYTDYEIDTLKAELEDFLKAYGKELRMAVNV